MKVAIILYLFHPINKILEFKMPLNPEKISVLVILILINPIFNLGIFNKFLEIDRSLKLDGKNRQNQYAYQYFTFNNFKK